MSDRTNVEEILDGATATGAGSAFDPNGAKATFHAYGSTSSGSGSATIDIEATNKSATDADAIWVTLGTITLTLGTTITADAFVIDAPYGWVRANVTAISGTGATVDVHMGVER